MYNAARELDQMEAREHSNMIEAHSQRYIDLNFGGENYEVVTALIFEISNKSFDDVADLLKSLADGHSYKDGELGEVLRPMIEQMADKFKQNVLEDAHERGIEV